MSPTVHNCARDGALKGQVWIRHLAPAAPAFARDGEGVRVPQKKRSGKKKARLLGQISITATLKTIELPPQHVSRFGRAKRRASADVGALGPVDKNSTKWHSEHAAQHEGQRENCTHCFQQAPPPSHSPCRASTTSSYQQKRADPTVPSHTYPLQRSSSSTRHLAGSCQVFRTQSVSRITQVT